MGSKSVTRRDNDLGGCEDVDIAGIKLSEQQSVAAHRPNEGSGHPEIHCYLELLQIPHPASWALKRVVELPSLSLNH